MLKYGYYRVFGGAIYDGYIGLDFPGKVLYTDGQFIAIDSEGTIWEGKLSVDEMCDLLHKMDSYGLHDIPNGTHYFDSPIYEMPTDMVKSYDADEYHLLVNGQDPKEIGVYFYYAPYLIPSMKKILKFGYKVFSSRFETL